MRRIARDLGVPVAWLYEAALWAPLVALLAVLGLALVLTGFAEPIS